MQQKKEQNTTVTLFIKRQNNVNEDDRLQWCLFKHKTVTSTLIYSYTNRH